MELKRSGSQPSAQGPEEYFTGTVRIDVRFSGTGDARVGGATVTFEPGARTAWHMHSLGHTLLIIAGLARKHWHGAAPHCAMTHVANAETLDGKAVEWMEKVTDAQYGA